MAKKKLARKVIKAAKKAIGGAIKRSVKKKNSTPKPLRKPRTRYSVSAKINIGTGRKKKRQLKKIKKWESKK